MIIALLFAMLLTSSEAATIDLQAYTDGDWDSIRAKFLVQPNSPSNLRLQLASLERVKALRTLCDVQLRGIRLPVSCFELLELEKDLRVLPKNRWAENLKRIDEICLSAARKIVDFKDDQFGIRLPQSKCREAVADRFEKLKYGSTLRQPADVFSTRHRF